jgi:hypothetical protein
MFGLCRSTVLLPHDCSGARCPPINESRARLALAVVSQTPSTRLDEPPLDLDEVVAEIMAEAAQRRRDGTYPPELERSLAATFARFAPAGALGTDLNALLDRLEHAGVIDADVPVDSARAGVPYVKKVVRKSTGWYQRYVAQQVTGFAHITARTMRTMADRLEAVSDAHPATSAAVARFVAGRALADDANDVQQCIVTVLQERVIDGRVAHLGAGAGALVGQLSAAAIDSYGVDVANSTVKKVKGIELRDEDPRAHALRLQPGALGALVMTSWLELAAIGHRLSMLSACNDVVRNNGVLVVAVCDGESLSEHYDGAMLDVLGVARWSIDTWLEVVRAAGWTQIERHALSNGRCVLACTR